MSFVRNSFETIREYPFHGGVILTCAGVELFNAAYFVTDSSFFGHENIGDVVSLAVIVGTALSQFTHQLIQFSRDTQPGKGNTQT